MMKILTAILIAASITGCATYEVSTIDEHARANWKMSMERRLLPLQQESIIIPDEYRVGADNIESEILQHGYITGYNWARSGNIFHANLNIPPSIIAADAELSEIWMKAMQAGQSNGISRVNKHLNNQEK